MTSWKKGTNSLFYGLCLSVLLWAVYSGIFWKQKLKKNYSVTDEYFIIQKDNNTKHSQGTTSPNQLWNPIKVKHRVTSREFFVFVIIFL